MKRKTEYCSGYVWEKGRCKQNQDALLIRQINKRHNKIIMGVVCDGIAGLSKGELASTYTVYRLLKKNGCHRDAMGKLLSFGFFKKNSQ